MNAEELAKYIIVKCCKDRCYINNYQLQKIMFLLQVKYIEQTGEPLFYDSFEAWAIGPVIPKVYYKWCGFGMCSITNTLNKNCEEPEHKEFIDAIVEEKRALDPVELIKEFEKVYKQCEFLYTGKKPYTKIPMSWLILMYYTVRKRMAEKKK